MTVNSLMIEVRHLLLVLLAEQGLTDVQVLAAYQPTAQGREMNAIYFFPVGLPRAGWQGRSYTSPDTGSGAGIRTERQQMEVSMPFEAFTDIAFRLRAADLLTTAAMIMHSLSFITAARQANIGVQRITALRNPYFKNESDRFEASPSFDIQFSYHRAMDQAQEFTRRIESRTGRVGD